ncbi:MAG: sensor histidine kinase N-terminal domain-containing protein [Pseudomonadales bacterium]|nr:sensor histidine kinase N-terminal domain-containing protein [Pseudomonadales bacterium]
MIKTGQSIRSFLLFSLLASISFVTLIATLWGYIESKHEVEELFDAQLAQYARVLNGTLRAKLDHQRLIGNDDVLVVEAWHSDDTLEDGEEYGEGGHKYEKKIFFQVWSGNRLLARSDNAPQSALSKLKPGFSSYQDGSHDWRVFVLVPGQNVQFVVAERDDVRDELAEKIAIEAFFPVVFGAPLLAWLIWLIVGRGLFPLKAIAMELRSKKASDLQPLDSKDVPDELLELVIAINALFKRLQNAFDREQRFTSNAAHELRTPLSGILLHAQSGQKQQALDAKNQSLCQIEKGAKRASYIVEQLLVLGRLEGQTTHHFSDIDLVSVCADVCESLRLKAAQKQQELLLVPSAPVFVQGVEMALMMLVRNLVENSLHHTPEYSRVMVDISVVGERVELSVMDNGPGIPEHVRHQVFERFYRVNGDRSGDVSDKGAGLGMAIVKEIAEQHGAQVKLEDNPGGGLLVIVSFPCIRVHPA